MKTSPHREAKREKELEKQNLMSLKDSTTENNLTKAKQREEVHIIRQWMNDSRSPGPTKRCHVDNEEEETIYYKRFGQKDRVVILGPNNELPAS